MMQELKTTLEGELYIPERYRLSKTKRRIHVKTPYMTYIETLEKDGVTVNCRHYFRHKPQKPYVPEGYVEIDGNLFKVIKAQEQREAEG